MTRIAKPRRDAPIRLTDERGVLVVAYREVLADDDVIIHYEGDEVIGLTILHAGKR